ncbi:DinB family protein [Chryseobacterium sp. L7]|uniref:DinB family protein n=1 Tax=Chryseobacterium endalhagicum TaxID=2797638 RepID=A0ABS1QD96_9FLAO|nr:DinB family protein [Chryseobacterium endalhagicum]MBL1220257.1 DinB family protein [Chryseobacterium endalhagicum]
MIPSIIGLANILKLNDRLFINALENITHEHTLDRLSEYDNPVSWLTNHIVWGRYEILNLLGRSDEKNPYTELFKNFKPYDRDSVFNQIEYIKEEWNKIALLTHEALELVTEEKLAEEPKSVTPMGIPTKFGNLSFFVWHEGYHLGQLAFLKKHYTEEAMKFF